MTNVTPYFWCTSIATFLYEQRKVGYPYITIISNVEVERIYFINFYFVLLFQAKAIALAAKNGKDVTCVSVSEYLQSIQSIFGRFKINIADISSGENRKIFHEQECEKTLITLLASEVR